MAGTNGGSGEEGRDPITLIGLILESATALRRQLTPSLAGEVALTGQATEVLIRLNRSPGGALRMSDLAAQTGLTRSGLTRALDRLVEAGLCERAECANDRRGSFAILTERARPLVEEMISRLERETREVLGDALSPDEERRLAALLTKLRDRVHPDAALLTALPGEADRVASAATHA